MSTLRVNLPGREYDIVCQPGALDRAGSLLRPLLRGRLAAIVTDSNVEPLYASRLARSLHLAGFKPAVLEVPAGEPSKSPEVLAELWEQLMDLGLTRSDAVIALGGGVVGDLSGFAAATILRGVDFVQVPTTLLAQVDSSVGGKVAVDLRAGKNLAGAFYQPKMVIMDPNTLDTLPLNIFMDGMAEVVKYGCIWDRDFFEFLEARPSRKELMASIEQILYTCCDIKRQVVMEDERDTGRRMLLNFGHTLGHAYELAGNYVEWTHGEAVAAGMCMAARMGVRLGLTPADVPERIAGLCAALGLPTAIACDKETYVAAIGLDKKGKGADISLILLEELGHAVIDSMPKSEVLRLLDELCGG